MNNHWLFCDFSICPWLSIRYLIGIAYYLNIFVKTIALISLYI